MHACMPAFRDFEAGAEEKASHEKRAGKRKPSQTLSILRFCTECGANSTYGMCPTTRPRRQFYVKSKGNFCKCNLDVEWPSRHAVHDMYVLLTLHFWSLEECAVTFGKHFYFYSIGRKYIVLRAAIGVPYGRSWELLLVVTFGYGHNWHFLIYRVMVTAARQKNLPVAVVKPNNFFCHF